MTSNEWGGVAHRSADTPRVPRLIAATKSLDVEVSTTQTMQIGPKELARLVCHGDPDIPMTSYVDGLMHAYAQRAVMVNWEVRIMELNGQWRKEGSHGIFRNLTGEEREVWSALQLLRKTVRELDLIKQEAEVEHEGSFRNYYHVR